MKYSLLQTVINLCGDSEFLLAVYGALAQEESANLSKRVKFGKSITSKKGRVPNVVFGYDKVIGDRYKLNINEEESKIIKEIFDLYVNKQYGTTKIARILNERGIKTKREKTHFTGTAIARMLKHKIYTGQVVNGQSEIEDFLTGKRKIKTEDEHIIVEREELRIIPDDLYEQAQEILQKNKKDNMGNLNKVQHNKNSSLHPYSTLIKCEHCGYSFIRREHKYKNTYIRWRCSGRKAHGDIFCNNNVTIDESELNTAIKEYFNSILKNKELFIKKTIQKYNKIIAVKTKDIKSAKDLEKDLEKLKRTKQKYIDMHTDEIVSKEELKELTGNINIQMRDLENQIKIKQYEVADEETLNNDIRSKIEDIENILGGNDFTNSGLKKVIDVISVNSNGKIEVVLKGLTKFEYDEEVIIRDIDDSSTNIHNSENKEKPSPFDTSVHTVEQKLQGFIIPYFIELSRIHTNDVSAKVKLTVVC